MVTDKEQMILLVREEAARLLAKDDWMVSREFEGGEVMPDNVKQYRAALREECNSKENEINMLTSDEDLLSYQNKPFTKVRNGKTTTEVYNMLEIYLTKDPRISESATILLTPKELN